MTDRKNKPVSEGFLLLILAGMQFTSIMDFVIMMPLGATFMKVFEISPQQFGFLVSSYSISAFFTGILSAPFVDRLDRKTALLWMYFGFNIGTLFCAIAPTYTLLMAARIVAGAFGGVMGAAILSIVGDAVPQERRGAAVGTVMASFSAATIAGVPLGLFLAENFGWQMPFYLITLLGICFWILGFLRLPSFTDHLKRIREGSPLLNFLRLWTHASHVRALIMMTLLMLSGFTLIPYIAPYLVYNVGIGTHFIPWVYFCGGVVTIFSSRFIGRLADKYGRKKVFTIIGTLSIVPILVITRLPALPLVTVLVITTVFITFVNGRFVPAMALITMSAKPAERGGFMSISSSVQHLAAGVAALMSGMVIEKAADGKLVHYDLVGYMAVAASVCAIAFVWTLRSEEGPVKSKEAETAVPVAEAS